MPFLFILLLLFFSCGAQSEVSIHGDRGTLFFVEKPDETIGDNVIAVFFDDKNGGRYFVDYLPYLSSKGIVKESFYLNTDTLKERYIVIHQSQIDSDTGMNWSSYFNVIVFSYSNGRLTRDDKLTSYFGSGGDIANPNGVGSISYSFPYKKKEKIIQATGKNEFKKWMIGEDAKLKIKAKSYFFPEPIPINRSKSYLIKGDDVLRKKHESGWDYIMYKS